MSNEGWIKLHRQIQASDLWPKRRRFSMFEAWVDLLMSANWRDSKVLRGYQLIDVKRGQVFTSAVALAKRWRWNRKSIVLFLNLLKADTMADIKTSMGRDTGYTLITILNYEKYQGDDSSELDTENDAAPDTKRDTKRTLNGTYHKNLKKNKEEDSAQAQPSLSLSSPSSKRKKTAPRRADPAVIEAFERFYQAYPRHEGRQDALTAWTKLNPTDELTTVIMAAVERYTAKVRDSEPRFIKHPGPWLNAKRWEDEPAHANGNAASRVEFLDNDMVKVDGFTMSRADYERRYAKRQRDTQVH